MKRMSKKLSRKSDKKKSSSPLPGFALPQYAWQGEETSVLDGVFNKQASDDARMSTSSQHDAGRSNERRYVRERHIPSADNMLTGGGGGGGGGASSKKTTATSSSIGGGRPLENVGDVVATKLSAMQSGDPASDAARRPRSDCPMATTCSSPGGDDRTPMADASDAAARLPSLPETAAVASQPVLLPASEPVQQQSSVDQKETESLDSSFRDRSFCSTTPDMDETSVVRPVSATSSEASLVSASTGHSHDAEVVQRLLERISQLERRNQQLAFDVDQLSSDKRTVAEVTLVADEAVLKWKTLEARHNEDCASLKERLSVAEVHTSSLEKQNTDLTEQLTKSIGGNASLKQRLVALGETVSRSASPAWTHPPSHGPAVPCHDTAADRHVSAELESKSKEVASLYNERTTLQLRVASLEADSQIEIEKLKEEVKSAKTERLLAERMCQRQQQLNEQLVQEKTVLASERTSTTSTQSPVASAQSKNTVHVKQLESLLQFVGTQLPSTSSSGRRASASEGLDLTCIRQQVVFAKQRLSSADEATQSSAATKKQLADVRRQAEVLQAEKGTAEALLVSERVQFEARLASSTSDLTALDMQLGDAVAEKEALESRVAELETYRSTMAAPTNRPQDADQQQLLTLRQDRAQLRVKLRHLQKQDETQIEQIRTLTASQGELSALLELTKDKLQTLEVSREEMVTLGKADLKRDAELMSAHDNKVSAIRQELDQLHTELSAAREREVASKEAASRLNTTYDTLSSSNAGVLQELEQARSSLASLEAKNSSLAEQIRLVNLHNASLKEDLDSALVTCQAKDVDEVVEAEKAKLAETLHLAREQLSDRGTMVRELKQQNEQLYEKFQQETKRTRELSDCVESSRKQLSHKEMELRKAEDEIKDINAAIDEMEQLPRANRRLQDEIQVLRTETKMLKASKFDRDGSHPLEGKELDQAYRQMEWRLMQLETQQEQWRHERDELEQLRVAKDRLQAMLSEASEEVAMLKLHNQQIRYLQEQFSSKSNEVDYLEGDNRQLQRELREVEVEVAVWKEKTGRYVEERQSLVEDQHMHDKLQPGQGGESHHKHVLALQERIVKLDEERSMLAARAMDGAQRQQRLSAQVQSLEAVKTAKKGLEEEVANLKCLLEQAQSRPAAGNGPHSAVHQSHDNSRTNKHVTALENGGDPERLEKIGDELKKTTDTESTDTIPPGYDLMEDFVGTESVDDDVMTFCNQHQSGKLNADAEHAVKTYWFKVTDHTGIIDTSTLGRFLHFMAVTSEDLLRRVVNWVDSNGNTALHYLLLRGKLLAAWLLLQTGVCRVDARNAGGYTCCMMVCVAPPAEVEKQQFVVKKLFQLGDIDLQAAQDGQTALMLAVGRSHRTVIELLLNAKCHVNMQDMDGSTALMFASELGEEDIVRLILSREDCDLHIKDRDGNTALQIALEKRHRDVSVLLYAALVYGKNKEDVSSANGQT